MLNHVFIKNQFCFLFFVFFFVYMVQSSQLYIVSAKMWLIVKIAVRFWIPIFLQICILAT